MRALQKTTESNEQVVVPQSKLEELETTIRTLKRDQGVMAEDKVALTRDRDNLALALKTMEDQNIGLRQGLSQEREAYSNVFTSREYTMSLNHLLIPYAASKRFSRTDR